MAEATTSGIERLRCRVLASRRITSSRTSTSATSSTSAGVINYLSVRERTSGLREAQAPVPHGDVQHNEPPELQCARVWRQWRGCDRRFARLDKQQLWKNWINP